MSKILFILKRREDFNASVHNKLGLSTGLFNSASFMNHMLNNLGIESDLKVAIDNNCIDKLVSDYNPTHVIIEALWVVPQKFVILQKLHPNVIWIIRLHSEMPFLAGEGSALDWIGDYSNFKNIIIGINAPRMLHEISVFLKTRNNWSNEQVSKKLLYLPNYYPQDYKTKVLDKNKEYIDISCFGAIRPLKNHILQAFAAIDFANQIGKKLRFHINAGRVEMKGDAVMNNLYRLFEQISDSNHQLIGHQWRPREEFLDLCSGMDIGLQVSFSETFNIVSADLLSQGIPLVTTFSEVPWSIEKYCANPVDSTDIVKKLHITYNEYDLNVLEHQESLSKYTNKTSEIWNNYFKKEI